MNVEPLTVPGTMDSLKPIRDYVSAVSTQARLDQKAAYRLALAVDEIATNAILHDFQKHGSDGSLTIQAEITPEELTIVLDDNGEAYDPRRAPLPDETDLAPELRRVGGFGVHFTLNNVDQFRYERHTDRNRNIFVMWRGAHPKEPAQVPIGPELSSLLLISARKAGDEVSRLYLERLGFHVNEAVDAQQARHVLTRERIELALLDADLDPDGTILVELRATPSLPEVPMAILVRPDQAEKLPHYFDLGARCYCPLVLPTAGAPASGVRRQAGSGASSFPTWKP
jgi:anti-sigma regulatory factor (Ser/Thr protein kinase)/CheY-like chemotaxis protein